MGKYGALINQAKSQETIELEIEKTREPESKKTRKMGNQKARKAESQTDEEMVNLGVKVPLTWRRHWAAESKRRGVSMTEIIIEALTKRFGKPE